MKALAPAIRHPFLTFKVSTDVLLDIADRVFILCLFTFFVYRTHNRFLETLDPRFALLVCSEVLPMVFVVLRPLAKMTSRNPSDWIFAFAGSALPLFITMGHFNPFVPNVIWYCIVVFGIVLQLVSKIFLGLSFGAVAANRGVKVGGPYAYIRHPIYAGYTVSHIGLLLAMPSVQNLFLYLLAFALQIVRMGREEAVLLQDEKYRELCGRVRYRVMPGVY